MFSDKILGVMQENMHKKKIQDVNELRKWVVEETEQLDQSVNDSFFRLWRCRLRTCVKATWHFERELWKQKLWITVALLDCIMVRYSKGLLTLTLTLNLTLITPTRTVTFGTVEPQNSGQVPRYKSTEFILADESFHFFTLDFFGFHGFNFKYTYYNEIKSRMRHDCGTLICMCNVTFTDNCYWKSNDNVHQNCFFWCIGFNEFGFSFLELALIFQILSIFVTDVRKFLLHRNLRKIKCKLKFSATKIIKRYQ